MGPVRSFWQRACPNRALFAYKALPEVTRRSLVTFVDTDYRFQQLFVRLVRSAGQRACPHRAIFK